MNSPSYKPLPAWQDERAKILQRTCHRILAREQAGQSRHKAVGRFSRRWDGKSLKADPARRLRLKTSTLYNLYSKWRQYGQTAEAFHLNFQPGNRRIVAPVLIRFVNFAAERDFKSFKDAWRAFCQRGGSFGPGRVTLGYDALLWNLPKGCFSELKRWRSIKRQAEMELQKARLRSIAQIQARVPAKLLRRKPSDFQI